MEKVYTVQNILVLLQITTIKCQIFGSLINILIYDLKRPMKYFASKVRKDLLYWDIIKYL